MKLYVNETHIGVLGKGFFTSKSYPNYFLQYGFSSPCASFEIMEDQIIDIFRNTFQLF